MVLVTGVGLEGELEDSDKVEAIAILQVKVLADVGDGYFFLDLAIEYFSCY